MYANNKNKQAQQQQQYQQYQQQQQYANMMRAGAAGANYDEYYDDELDQDDELQYQQMMALHQQQQKRSGAQTQAVDPQIQQAEALLGEGFEIMQEELDEEYDPTIEEIEEYAKYLGMDMQQDRDLFYIAKEGLKAPLPDQWKPCRSPGGNIYYFNFDSKQLQKDHPCDDYYKRYYHTQKSQVRRKKEEKVIKKQIKEQHKQQVAVQQQVAVTNNNNPNSSIQQMMLMNISNVEAAASGIGSTSIINERVQIELEALLDEYEEQKIQHERQKRESLKSMQTQHLQSKKQIQEQALKDLDLLRTVIQKSTQQKDKEQRVATRRAQLQTEKDKRMRQVKEEERGRASQAEKDREHKLDKRREQLKKEEEKRHKLEIENFKNRYQQKLQIEKEKIQAENNRLLEESGDIDYQVRLFKDEVLVDQFEKGKRDVEKDYNAQLQAIKVEMQKKLEREKEKFEQEFEQKLDREREKELRKYKLEMSRIDDKKDDVAKQSQQQLKEQKRNVERAAADEYRDRTIKDNADHEQRKDLIKTRVVQQYDLKGQKIEKDYQAQRAEGKKRLDDHESQVRAKAEKEQDKIERELSDALQTEKREFAKQENEKSETYQQIIKEIQTARSQIKEMMSKRAQVERQRITRVKEIGDLEIDKRGKERLIKNAANSISGEKDQMELMERQLQREVQEKQEELERLKAMIRDKQIENETKEFYPKGSNVQDNQYQNITKEIDQVKVMILDLRSNHAGVELPQEPNSFHRRAHKQANIPSYSLTEIQAFIELKLPKIKTKREKAETDRVLMRQLLANIDRNRIKIRKELLEQADLPHSRRLAISSIKDRIDEQARDLEQEEARLKDLCDMYRRKEDKLRVIKHKSDLMEKSQSNANERDGLLREMQNDYHKYLETYQKEKDQKRILGIDSSKEAQRNYETKNLESRWSSYLKMDNEDFSLNHISHIDHKPAGGERTSYQRPSYQYVPARANHTIYDRELQRVRDSKVQVKSFIEGQQRWLSKMKQEVISCSLKRPVYA